jgi:hypothetical protein
VWIYLGIKLCKKQGKSGKIQNENVGYRGGNVKISKCENSPRPCLSSRPCR